MGRTIKDAFRLAFGYDKYHVCKDCKYLHMVSAGSRNVYKCRKMGITASTATDIRLKDMACRLFERSDDGEEQS